MMTPCGAEPASRRRPAAALHAAKLRAPRTALSEMTHHAPRPRRYVQVDVFAHRPGVGNPLGVVLDAEGLDDDTMQAIARWTRLPETTFVFPPADAGASYRFRIFSARRARSAAASRAPARP